MAGDSARQALARIVERFRSTIACVTDAHVYGEGIQLDEPHSMIAVASGGGVRLPLQAVASGSIDLFLEITHQYTITHALANAARGSYAVRSERYLYEIFDFEGRELLLYHWHPVGVSDIRFPHLHAACTPLVPLPHPRTDNRRTLDVAKSHLPTSRVLLEDVIELLIRDFGVEPRPDFRDADSPRYWQNILDENREVMRRV